MVEDQGIKVLEKKEGAILKVQRILITMISTVIFTLSSVHSVKATTTTQFSIVYTNDVMGEVEPCG